MKSDLFFGVDIGGTKIAAALVDENGKILSREKYSTPEKAAPKEILENLVKLLYETLDKEHAAKNTVKGIGIGIPGIVDGEKNKIVATPNINLAGFPLAQEVEKEFGAKTVLGNDVNLGLLGEQWLGCAKGARNVVGIFPGTGVGGAIIINGKIYLGAKGAAAEIGHMIIEANGPDCSCGNRGCLEALASRWAIERDIRHAIKKGEKTIVTELTDGDLSRIKSKILKKALEEKDPLVTQVMEKAARALGAGCVSLIHLLNPELIVLGGGVIEACGDFILPIVRKAVSSDPFFSKFDDCKIVESKLADDAVILGAVALAKEI